MTIQSPVIVAHRGLHLQHPENSFDAFLAAFDAKIPWVECDVWPDARGVPVVIHDATLDRTTTGHGPVNQHTWQAMELLGVPPLGEVLHAAARHAGVMIEIKPQAARKFVSTILNQLNGHAGAWMLQSFDYKNISHLWHTFPCAWLIDTRQNLDRAIDSDCPRIHIQHALIDQELVDSLHAADREIGAWTVNDPAAIQRMIDFGVDMLITDEPLLAMQLSIRQSP